MEKWKDIPGYEGIYQASNTGEIRSVDGKTTFSSRHGVRVWQQRILKQKYHSRKQTSKSDARVTLWKDGSPRTLLVSRLIALTWCSGYSNGMTVNHIDGNPENNHASNLEWVSRAENIRLGFETGLYPTQKSCILIDKNGNRRMYRSQSEASRSIGRTNSYVANCLLKKRPILSSDGDVYGIY